MHTRDSQLNLFLTIPILLSLLEEINMESYTTVKTYTMLKKEKVIDFLSILQHSVTMKFLIFACLLAVALAKQVSVVRKLRPSRNEE